MEKRRRAINADMIAALSSAGCKVLKNEPLSKHSSFRIGGPADFLVEIPDENALSLFTNSAAARNAGFFVLGGGTNILFSDKGYSGTVIKLTGEFEKISLDGSLLSCGAGACLALAVNLSAKNGLSGLESCAGIPGTIGGAVFGNAGGKEKWIGECVESVELYRNGKKELLANEKIDFAYRSSGLEGCVLSKINFSLKKEDGNDILKEVSESIEKRAKTQPLSMPNAGCIFKNPPA